MLEVRGVDVRYGEATALRGVDLTVGDGEIVCIVGPNGAGKTTLAHAIAGMLPVASGSIGVDGRATSAGPAIAATWKLFRAASISASTSRSCGRTSWREAETRSNTSAKPALMK